MKELISTLMKQGLTESEYNDLESKIAARINEAAFEDSFYTLNVSILAKILDKAKSIKPPIIERLITNLVQYLGNDFLILLKNFNCDELDLTEAIQILDSIKISPLIREITNSIKKYKKLETDRNDIEIEKTKIDWELNYRKEKKASDFLRTLLEEESLKKNMKVKFEEISNACHAKDIKKLKDLYELDPMCITLIDSLGTSPLYISSNIEWSEGVEFLLEKGSSIGGFVDCITDGSTPLYTAISKRYLEIAKKLVDKGANVNFINKNLSSCLHIANNQNNIEAVKILVEAGANTEIKNEYDYTPLGISAREGRLEIVKYLLSKGAKIDTPQNKGFTPLYLACEQGRVEVAEYLIKNGANTTFVSLYGISPIEIATKNGHLGVVKLWVEKKLPFNNKAIEFANAFNIQCLQDWKIAKEMRRILREYKAAY